MEEAIFIIEQKLYRLRGKYNFYKESLSRKTVGSKHWNKTLGCIQSYGSKIKTLTEVLHQLRQIKKGELKIHRISRKGGIMFVTHNSRDKRNSCVGKVRHSSLEIAEQAANSFLRDKGEVMEAYKCRYCEFWHIGHSLFVL